VWVDTDGEHVLVNTAQGRVKQRNVERDPRVALALIEHADPYNQLAIRGRVVETTFTGAEASIDDLARRYLGTESYPWRSPGERRVLLKIVPEHVVR
jgi:PPOX class probable F420-dependent enzyme